jgi:LysR family carnitine catabolism transcriptional activator
MDLRQFEYVLAVVDHGGFTRAASALDVSQPSISQGVRALEAELGTELFHRTSRRVVLTAAGEAFVEPARRALRDAATARSVVAEVAGLRSGHLDLVCLPTLASDPVATLIGEFRADHPGVTVRLAEPEDPAAIGEMVKSGVSEIGITDLHVPLIGLVTHELESQEYVALVPTGHTTARSRPMSIGDLAASPLITTPPGTSTRRLVDVAFSSFDLSPRIAVETDHRDAIIALVIAGAGVSVLPRPVAASAALGSPSVSIRTIDPTITRRVGLVHRDGPLSPAAHTFVATATEGRPATRGRPSPRRRST